jgi:DNA polymerase-1
MNRVLIIDAMNMYFRNYIINPSISTNGNPIGGLKGFLQSLQKTIKDVNPSEIIICWDGGGGSKKRKSLVKTYKEGRSPIRLNRSIRQMTREQEIENKNWQLTRLFSYLNELPVIQLIIDDIEADDIISQVAQHPVYWDWQKVIVSSDKDFFQLLNESTILIRPIQKKIVNKNNILEDFKIHPNNFALARSIVGDKTDNLPGVPGIGLPTVAKRFPFLVEEKSYTIQEIIDHCEDNKIKNIKAYNNILDNEDLIELNYKMMQLYAPSISVQSKGKIDHTISNFEYDYDKQAFEQMMIQDGFGQYPFENLFRACQQIVKENK